MEWKDLSRKSANILERCWGLRSDKPTTYKTECDEETYKEILEWKKENNHFDLKYENGIITVWGICEFGSWQ